MPNMSQLFLSFSIMLLSVNTASAHGWMAPKKDSAVNNPIPLTEVSSHRGKEVFEQNCAACHGEDIEGIDAQEIGLTTRPPNLKERLRTHSDGDFFWKIRTGRGEMPQFKENLSEEEIWDIINYIRSQSG